VGLSGPPRGSRVGTRETVLHGWSLAVLNNKAGGAQQVGVVFFFCMLLSFSTMEAYGKWLSQTFPVLQVVWARYTFHFVLIVAVMILLRVLGRGPRFHRSHRPRAQMIRSVFLFGMTFFYFHALARLPIAEATAIIFTAPLIMSVLSGVTLGERVGWQEWCAALVGFAGVLIVVQPLALIATLTGDGDALPPGTLTGVAAGITGAFLFAFYMLSSRFVSVVDPPETGLLYSSLAGVVVTSTTVPFDWQTPDAVGWGMLAVIGGFGALGQYLAGFAFARVQASKLAPLTYVQLLFAVSYGVLLFGTVPGLNTLAGAGLIVLAGIYTYRRTAGAK